VYCVEMAKDTAIVAMKCEYETVPKLSTVCLQQSTEDWQHRQKLC